MALRDSNFELGFVIPCYNEEEVLPHLIEELKAFADRRGGTTWVLLVDDGSTDRTPELIEQACRQDARFGGVRLSRNFGHQLAVSAGLRFVRGDAVVVMDADLQDPLSVVETMITRWREGNDVVYAVRRGRQESFLLRAAYAIFYRLLRAISQIEIPLDSGDFSLMDRKVVDCLNAMPERRRFVRGLRAWTGFRQTSVEYERPARYAGRSKYTLGKLLGLALSGILSFSSAPLRLATWLGLTFSGVAFLCILYALAGVVFRRSTPTGWASLVVLIVFFAGVQLLVLGIMGEYIAEIVDEVKGRPQFLVAGRHGWTAGTGEEGLRVP